MLTRPALQSSRTTRPGASFILATALASTMASLTASMPSNAVSFNDVGNARGLTHTGTTYGGAWSKDANGDGKPDLWLGNHSTGDDPILYLSTPSGFSPSNALNGLVSSDFHGAAWADFNNDGHQDLLVMAGGGAGVGEEPNQLFVGNGNSWTEQGEALNVDYPFGRARQATWLDWNNDGHLDVALINKNDRPEPPFANSQIFTWSTSSQKFVEENFTIHDKVNQSFAQLSINNPALGGSGPALITWARSNNGGPDVALRYTPSGFSNADNQFGLPQLDFVNDAIAADFDNNGGQDFFAVSGGGEHLLLQDGSGFSDQINGSGIQTNSSAFVLAADFNNDMLVDIYIVRSNLGSDVNRPNVLYLNQGGGNFTAVSNAGGAQGTLQGLASGASVVDYNNDGWMDIFTTNSDNWSTPAANTIGAPMQLFENTTASEPGTPNRWLKIVLEGTSSNRDGIGASVTVVAGGVTQMREMNGGIHNRSQDDPRLHFGLGNNNQANTVTITWPSGTVQQLNNVASNQILTVTEQGGGGGNASPTARFDATPGNGALEIDVDGSASSDPDGNITNYAWNFGDGSTANGAIQSHSYSAAGTYSVALTVTDNAQATDTRSEDVQVGSPTGGSLTKAAITVADVGARASIQGRLIDEVTNGSQNLATFWRNDNTIASGWITLDFGQAKLLQEVRIATREKKSHLLEISIGASLSDGQVTGGIVRNCNKPNLGPAVAPSGLFTCPINPGATGRYVTIRGTNKSNLRIYGVELWVDGSGGGNTNTPPSASFTSSKNQLQVDFDGSGSSDSDGTITNWSWNFGDGTSDTGVSVDHTYASSGNYPVTLTVTDDEQAVGSTQQNVQVSDGTTSSKITPTIEDASARRSAASKAIDELGNGTQRLSSKWGNNGETSTSWLTLDMATTRAPTQLLIAPRADRSHNYVIYVGDSLTGGKVNASASDTCAVPVTGSTSVPTVLSSCSLSGVSGRYITIESPGAGFQRFYGIELYE